MKRILISLFVIAIAAGSLDAQEEKSPFSVYSGDRTSENFLKAFNNYESQRADTMNYGATAIIAWLHMMELERNIGILDASLDKLPPKNKFAYANLLLEMGKYDRAIEIYSMLNESSPKWSCPWRHKGEALWKKKEYEAAVKSLEMAIQTRETHYDAYVMLSEVQREMGLNAEALATLEKGLTHYGKDIEDPNEEVADHHVQKLYLDLLQKNGKTEKYNELKAKLEKTHPGEDWILK